MTAAFHHLLPTASVMMLAVLLLGLLFQIVPPCRRRDALTGLLCGLFAAASLPVTGLSGDHALLDGRLPLIAVAGLLGGPLAAAAAVPLPAAAAIAAGDLPLSAATLAAASAATLGASATATLRTQEPGPWTALALSLLAPLTVVAYAVPELSAPGTSWEALLGLAAWTGLSTLATAILALHERERGDRHRAEGSSARLRRVGDLVTPAVMDSQILHYWRLHERHGTDYAYMLVSIDDAPALRRSLGPRRWERLRERVATVLRLSVRECDLCAAVDFDRFGVLLPYANLPLALPVAERIRARIGEAMAADELAGRVSVSVGLADAATTCGIVDVKAAAEGALYTANARAPRGAIGSAADSVESDGLIRSFPGAVRNAPVTPHAPAPAAAVPAGFVVITADADDEGLDTPHAA